MKLLSERAQVFDVAARWRSQYGPGSVRGHAAVTTNTPRRIQLSRAKGWRMPDGAVSVARPGKWGNPYTVEDFGLELALELFENTVQGCWSPGILDHVSDELCAKAYALHCAFRRRFRDLSLRYDLRGHDLACWCKLPAPGEPDLCHAAVLLRLANEEA